MGLGLVMHGDDSGSCCPAHVTIVLSDRPQHRRDAPPSLGRAEIHIVITRRSFLDFDGFTTTPALCRGQLFLAGVMVP